MSANQKIPDFLEAQVKKMGSPDEDNKSEIKPLPTVMSIDVPALASDEIVNFMISDEKPNLPSESKNPKVEQDSLAAEQPTQAGPSRSLSVLRYLEILQTQPASAASVQNKQTEADSTSADDNSAKSLAGNSDHLVKPVIGDVSAEETQHAGEKQRTVHPKKRKCQSPEDPQDPLSDKKVSKTVATALNESEEKVSVCKELWQWGHGQTTEAWSNCHVSIDNSWINPARLSKEVERILKIRLEQVQMRAKEKQKKLKAVARKLKEGKEVITGLSEKNERQLEAIGVLNQQLKAEKEAHTNDLQVMSKQVRI